MGIATSDTRRVVGGGSGKVGIVKGDRGGNGEREKQPSVKGEIRDFTDLLVWQKAIVVGKEVYKLTKRFPRDERYALTSQVRRAAVSVSSNIAEGHARQGREFAHFLSIARGSLAETESQLLFAVEIEYLTRGDIATVRALANELHRMIASLVSKLGRRD